MSMKLIASFSDDDAQTKELFNKWEEAGAAIEVSTEKRFLGGAEVLSAAITLTPVVAFLIGKYLDVVKNSSLTIEHRGVKIAAKGFFDEKRLLDLLRQILTSEKG